MQIVSNLHEMSQILISGKNNKNINLLSELAHIVGKLFFTQNLGIFIVPRLFEEKWRDTVFGFPWCVVRGAWCVARGAWCVVRGSEFLVGTLSP